MQPISSADGNHPCFGVATLNPLYCSQLYSSTTIQRKAIVVFPWPQQVLERPTMLHCTDITCIVVLVLVAEKGHRGSFDFSIVNLKALHSHSSIILRIDNGPITDHNSGGCSSTPFERVSTEYLNADNMGCREKELC